MYTQEIANGPLLKQPDSEKLKSGCVILEPDQEVGAHVTTGKEEVLVILEGTATVRCEEEITRVPQGNIAYIPKETDHNVQNNGSVTLKYIYLVTPV